MEFPFEIKDIFKDGINLVLPNQDEVVYIGHDASVVIGFLKVGRKKLFFHDESGNIGEYMPLCVLDFYINEEFQRKGYGIKLFHFMLKQNNIPVESLAIDSPSAKMLSFLRRHFGLRNPLRQSNNYVVYRDFFVCKKNKQSSFDDSDEISAKTLRLKPINLKESNIVCRNYDNVKTLNVMRSAAELLSAAGNKNGFSSCLPFRDRNRHTKLW